MGMNLIQTGRFNRLFQKLFSLKGGANVTEVGAEILPVMQLRLGAEVRYLESWERFGFFQLVGAGGAGAFGQIQIRNPKGSNVIAVVEKAYLVGKALDTPLLEIGANALDLATLITPQRFDPRGRAIGTIIPSSTTAVTGPVGPVSIYAADTTTTQNVEAVIYEQQEVTLLPGDVLAWLSQLANTSFSGGFWWRERAMEESELK
jgi:hypothetical protein